VFFVVDGEQTQCHNEQCKLARAAFVNSNSSCSFTCPHIVKAEEAVQPLFTHTLTPEVISQYKADQSTKDRLFEVMNAVHICISCINYQSLFSVLMGHQHLQTQLDLSILHWQIGK